MEGEGGLLSMLRLIARPGEKKKKKLRSAAPAVSSQQVTRCDAACRGSLIVPGFNFLGQSLLNH